MAGSSLAVVSYRLTAVMCQPERSEHRDGKLEAGSWKLPAMSYPLLMTHLKSDVVGSLLRPATSWRRARGSRAATIDAAEFKRIEDRAVDEAVALQEAAGLDVVTDGEMRRYAFFGHLVEALEGFDKRARLVDHLPRRPGPRGRAASGRSSSTSCAGGGR